MAEQGQTSRWYTLLGVLIVLAAAAALVLAVRAVFSLLASASPTVFAAVIATSGTILVSVASLIISNRIQARQQIRQAQRDRKAQVYEEMIAYWVGVMRGERRRAKEAERRKMDEAYYRSVPSKMLAWASEPVLEEYALRASPVGEDEPDRSIMDFEYLLLAVRKDLGYSNKGLSRGDLLRTFLTGVDEYLAEERE